MPNWRVTGPMNRAILEVVHPCGHTETYTYGSPMTAEREGPLRAAERCRRCRSLSTTVPSAPSPQVAPGFEAFLEDEDEPPPF